MTGPRTTTTLMTSTVVLVIALASNLSAGESDADGFVPLFDGKSLSGWTVSENPDSFSVKDGMSVANGPRAHLF